MDRPVGEEGIRLLVVLGPTASGKTRMAVALARALGGEVLSADSRQVYRGLTIGTGKDLAEYGQVPVHLVDLLEPAERYSVYRFQRDCFGALRAVAGRGALPVLCGGTGLYLEAVLERYEMSEVAPDEKLRAELAALSLDALAARLARSRRLHNVTDLKSRQTLIRAVEIAERSAGAPAPKWPALQPLVLGARWDRAELDSRIRARLVARIEAGMIEEAERLHAAGLSLARMDELGLEYRYLARLLAGELDREALVEQLGRAIRRFARRQLSWFRRMERRGWAIHWIDRADAGRALEIAAGRFGPDGRD